LGHPDFRAYRKYRKLARFTLPPKTKFPVHSVPTKSNVMVVSGVRPNKTLQRRGKVSGTNGITNTASASGIGARRAMLGGVDLP
jgi:hypothetical protein